MSDAGNVAKTLRERLGGNTEERLGKALSELLENPLLTGAIGRAFEAREKASQAQEVAMGALNLPSAADIERLTRRLRAVSHRLEGIEDGVDRLDRALSPAGVEARLAAIETHLQTLTDKVDQAIRGAADRTRAGVPSSSPARPRRPRPTTPARPRAAKPSGPAGTAKATSAAKAAKAARATRAAKTPGARARAGRPAAGKT
jgi:hypothetical protein